MQWKQWPKFAYAHELRIIGWPSKEKFPGPAFDHRTFWKVAKPPSDAPADPTYLPEIIDTYKSFASRYRYKTKSRDIDWSALNDVVQIVSWTAGKLLLFFEVICCSIFIRGKTVTPSPSWECSLSHTGQHGW